MEIKRISEIIEEAASKRVLFVGESIEDVYHYGTILSRPAKEPILCLDYKHSEHFMGGVHAAAEHARSFCLNVQIASNRVIQKHRYVEEAHTRKLFEIYSGHADLPGAEPDALSGYDCVVVTDYGHGMMTPGLIDRLCSESKFLAVNVQTNAGNYGFNLATKYSHANYLCFAEQEARLATQNQHGEIENSLHKLRTIADRVVITLGKRGAVGIDSGGVKKVAAFTERIVDTMGAGDAFFAITALISGQASLEELLTIGNAAGALKAQIIGHRQSVTKHALIAYLSRQSS